MIKRELYMSRIRPFIGSDLIKVMTGIRRCGKSVMLELIKQELTGSGVSPAQFISINFEDMSYSHLQTAQALHDEITKRAAAMEGKIYLFFDEIQVADGWQPFVYRIYEHTCKNIFITGSNSKMLSSELSTSLRGRTLQYEEFPLSFKEYCSFLNINTNYYTLPNRAKLLTAFRDYLAMGGFPEVVLAGTIYKERILQEYFFVMLYKDLVERYEIKNPEPVRYFIKRVMANLTKPTSINRIYNEMKSQGVSIGKNTLYDLIVQTESVYLFFPLTKYDPSLVKESSGDKKYYCIDNGLRSILLNPMSDDHGKLLENIVYLHLRRHLSLSGSLHYYKNKKECDFLVIEQQQISQLIQVSYDIHDLETRRREIEGLLEAALATGCRKLLILTMEEEEEFVEQGHAIQVLPVWKWMLQVPE